MSAIERCGLCTFLEEIYNQKQPRSGRKMSAKTLLCTLISTATFCYQFLPPMNSSNHISQSFHFSYPMSNFGRNTISVPPLMTYTNELIHTISWKKILIPLITKLTFPNCLSKLFPSCIIFTPQQDRFILSFF